MKKEDKNTTKEKKNTTSTLNNYFQPFCTWNIPENKIIETILFYIKLKKKLNEKQIANILGVTPRTIRRWKTGSSKISYSTWALLCNLVGYGVIWRKNFQPLSIGVPNITSETLTQSLQWKKPSTKEICLILQILKSRYKTEIRIAATFGISYSSLLRMKSGEYTINYSTWALFCYEAGFGKIWE